MKQWFFGKSISVVDGIFVSLAAIFLSQGDLVGGFIIAALGAVVSTAINYYMEKENDQR